MDCITYIQLNTILINSSISMKQKQRKNKNHWKIPMVSFNILRIIYFALSLSLIASIFFLAESFKIRLALI